MSAFRSSSFSIRSSTKTTPMRGLEQLTARRSSHIAALISILAALALTGLVAASPASAHRNACHTRHTCPSDADQEGRDA